MYNTQSQNTPMMATFRNQSVGGSGTATRMNRVVVGARVVASGEGVVILGGGSGIGREAEGSSWEASRYLLGSYGLRVTVMGRAFGWIVRPLMFVNPLENLKFLVEMFWPGGSCPKPDAFRIGFFSFVKVYT